MAKQYETWSAPAYRVPRTAYRVPRRGGWLGWLLFVLVAAAAAAFVWYLYLPLRAHRTDLHPAELEVTPRQGWRARPPALPTWP